MGLFLIRQHEWATVTNCWANKQTNKQHTHTHTTRPKEAHLVCVHLCVFQKQANLIFGVSNQESDYPWGEANRLVIGKGYERGFWSLRHLFYFILFKRERKGGGDRKTCIHWLILICALTEEQTCNLGVRGQHSERWSYLVRTQYLLLGLGGGHCEISGCVHFVIILHSYIPVICLLI